MRVFWLLEIFFVSLRRKNLTIRDFLSLRRLVDGLKDIMPDLLKRLNFLLEFFDFLIFEQVFLGQLSK